MLKSAFRIGCGKATLECLDLENVGPLGEQLSGNGKPLTLTVLSNYAERCPLLLSISDSWWADQGFLSQFPTDHDSWTVPWWRFNQRKFVSKDGHGGNNTVLFPFGDGDYPSWSFSCYLSTYDMAKNGTISVAFLAWARLGASVWLSQWMV